jgi:hypothetical protein
METITLVSVNSVTSTPQADVFIVHVTLQDETGVTFDTDYGSYPNDPHGVNPAIRQWLEDHRGNYDIDAPVEPTIDDLRATYPELKPTTFWKAAREVGVYKTDVLAQLNAIEDPAQREDALIDLEECLGFQRLNPLVVSLTSTYNITPEQLDDLWLWAANTQA